MPCRDKRNKSTGQETEGLPGPQRREAGRCLRQTENSQGERGRKVRPALHGKVGYLMMKVDG
jgi:hypothetical protein